LLGEYIPEAHDIAGEDGSGQGEQEECQGQTWLF